VSLGFPWNGSTGWIDAKSSKGRSGLYDPVAALIQWRQDEGRNGDPMRSEIAREQIQQKKDRQFLVEEVSFPSPGRSKSLRRRVDPHALQDRRQSHDA
jgi:hypothetical protein